MYVTYSDMFQFALVIVGVAKLIIALLNFESSKSRKNKKK